MSYYSQSQSFYGQQGWTYLNARTTTKPSEGPHLPLLALASNRTLTLGVVAVASAALPIGKQQARTLGTVAAVAQPVAIRRQRARTIGAVTAVAAPQAIRRARGHVLGPAAATASARPLSRGAARTLGTATVTAQALAVVPGGTHTDRVAGHIAGLTIGHIEALTASPGRTIGPRIGHLED